VFRSLPRAFSPLFSACSALALALVLALALALPGVLSLLLPGGVARAADPAVSPDIAPAAPAEIQSPPPAPSARPRVTLEPGWLTPDPVTGRPRLVAGVPAEAAEDDVIERVYTGRFRHEGIVPATGLRIVIEIPRGLHYVAGSATGPRAQVSFSADGGRSFAPPGELTVGVEPAAADPAPRKAEPADYTHIRWDLPGEFAPGTAGLVTFRARPATSATSPAASAATMEGA
jgi:hypothetical protein